MSEDQRQHVRTKLTSSVKLIHPDTGTIEVKTLDISDGGIYLLSGNSELPPVGSEVKVQLIDTPFEAPVLDMVIVRLAQNGIGLKFLNEE
ncbi:MAG: PilZ domain-containing protein [Gammaproteobacteria bacterium]|nr:PilZ domain-containing protein [Gammaproteobacteria bacterium]